MKLSLLLAFFGIFIVQLNAQIYVQTEYIGSSDYKDINNEKTGGEGEARIFSAGAQIPFSVKMDEYNHPKVWSMALGGSYTSLKNRDIPKELSPSEILNAQISLMHLRPISKKWSVLATLGAGVYTAHTDLSKVRMKNVLGHGGVIFIWHGRDNLDLGGGLAVNTSFGYPMAFPAIYLNWRLDGRYEVNVSLMNAFEVSGGIKFSKHFKLKLVGQMNGSLALETIDGKDMMFTHQYMIGGLQPEFKIGKSFSVPIILGVSAERPAYYDERSLQAFFKAMGRENNPHFSVAPYASVAFKYQF